MKHVWALLIKFAIVGTVLFSLYGIFNDVSLTAILFLALVTTGVSYVAGDLYIYPKFGNPVAILADFGLVLIMLWVLSYVVMAQIAITPFTAAFFSALAITATEPLFHVYVRDHVLSRNSDSYIPGVYKTDFSTELAEEQPMINQKAKNSKPGSNNPKNSGGG
ncbi:YndM family protein [Bacillus sp. FJAT-27251]|uniref:YndM family protein n=1 Tax=Bacillus sp. FJAT-27251 TaxID=1684142 RepID=UPI0006A794B3|nr:YndM family protein [Bacillus sp. FJAT-27251]